MPDSSNSLLAAIANPTIVNPFAASAQGMDMANKAIALQRVGSERAAGEAFLNSIRPDGTTDQNALLLALKGNPQTAYAAQQSAQAGQTLSTEEYTNHMTRLARGASGALQILADNNGTAPADQLRAYFDRAVKSGDLKPGDLPGLVAGIGDDPAANARIVLQRAGQSISVQQTLLNTRDQSGIANLPQGPRPYTVGAFTGPNNGAMVQRPGGMESGMSPGERSAPTKIGVDPHTQADVMGTREQYNQAATGQPLPNGTPIASPFGSGRYGNLPSALRNPNAAPQPGALPQPGAPPPGAMPPGAAPVASGAPTAGAAPARPAGIVMGGGPAADTMLRDNAAAGVKYFQDLTQRGTEAVGQRAVLQNILGENAQFVSGPYTKDAAKLAATAQTWVPGLARAFNIDPNALTARQTFSKQVAVIANAQGAGTDARLDVAKASNPNDELQGPAIDLITRQLIGNSDWQQAKTDLGTRWGNKTDNAGFEASVREQLDPRVFQYNRMTPEQKHTFATKTVKDPETFMAHYDWVKRQGLLPSAQ